MRPVWATRRPKAHEVLALAAIVVKRVYSTQRLQGRVERSDDGGSNARLVRTSNDQAGPIPSDGAITPDQARAGGTSMAPSAHQRNCASSPVNENSAMSDEPPSKAAAAVSAGNSCRTSVANCHALYRSIGHPHSSVKA